MIRQKVKKKKSFQMYLRTLSNVPAELKTRQPGRRKQILMQLCEHEKKKKNNNKETKKKLFTGRASPLTGKILFLFAIFCYFRTLAKPDFST